MSFAQRSGSGGSLGFLLSFIVVHLLVGGSLLRYTLSEKGGENYADDSCFFVESGKRWL